MAVYKIILVTGGVRSGKSNYAIQRAEAVMGERIYLATAKAIDDEMRAKISRHKQDRGSFFQTIEEPVYIAKAMDDLQSVPVVLVIDCLTVWINNLMHLFNDDEKKISAQQDLFVETLRSLESHVIIVTNEVGMGIVPDNRLSREYANKLGFFNQRIAQLSNELILMVSGIPQWIKGTGEPLLVKTRRTAHVR